MYHLPQDIKVICIRATSFPDGVMQAHQALHSLLPTVEGRTFYGISRPEGGSGILYRAAAEEVHEGEAEEYGCETFIIKKGDYLSETLTDWSGNEDRIGKTFQQLLADPRLDPEGYCLETYLSDNELRCMVPLKSN